MTNDDSCETGCDSVLTEARRHRVSVLCLSASQRSNARSLQTAAQGDEMFSGSRARQKVLPSTYSSCEGAFSDLVGRLRHQERYEFLFVVLTTVGTSAWSETGETVLPRQHFAGAAATR
jgi:hypothetical protein